jgi:signal transduction histidine kinase
MLETAWRWGSSITARELWRWFLTGIPASLHMDAQDRADLISEVRQKFIRDVYLIAAMITSFNVVYWFTDAWLMAPIAGAAEAFSLGRAKLVVLAVVTVIVHSLIPQRVYLTGLVAGTGACFVIGNLMGRVGSPSTAWFGFLYPFVLVSIGQWLTPIQRAGVVIVYGGAMLGGYFSANPAWLSDPLVGPSVGYFLYVLTMSYLVGLFVDYSKVRLFMTQRDLKQARAHLEERVSERTQTLGRLVAQMDRVQDMERMRLARELHDEVGQVLTAQRLAMRLMKRRYSLRHEDISPNLDQLEGLVEDVTVQFREVLRAQRLSVLDDLGLEKALQQLAHRSTTKLDLPCALRLDLPPHELDPELELIVYRCVQEGVTNAAKHARATRLQVEVRVSEDELIATVTDDGIGLGASAGQGFGLLGVRERVMAARGTFEVGAHPEGGTRLGIRLPLPLPRGEPS